MPAYLINKGVKPTDHMRARLGFLFVPKVDLTEKDPEKQVKSLQIISPDGTKRNLKGGQCKSLCFPISSKNDTIVVVEGVATACSVHEATNYTTLCAFGKDNL